MSRAQIAGRMPLVLLGAGALTRIPSAGAPLSFGVCDVPKGHPERAPSTPAIAEPPGRRAESPIADSKFQIMLAGVEGRALDRVLSVPQSLCVSSSATFGFSSFLLSAHTRPWYTQEPQTG
jgi:hypothetical protein